MITIPAVKIAEVAASLLDDDETPQDSMILPVSLCPDPCQSNENNTLPEEELPVPPTQGMLLPNLEDEFGQFLLDAVTWL